MQKKWYIGILITILSLLVVIQQQTVVPNQEIVLEFVNAETTAPEAQNAISIVTKQLQSVGVKNIRISKDLNDGKLKITYYSDADVTYIKKVLSKDQNLDLAQVYYDQNKDDHEKPEENNVNVKEYNLNIYEIQSSDADADFDGKYVFEIQLEQKGNFSSKTYQRSTNIDSGYLDVLTRVAQKINTNIAIAIDNTSRVIPEVRAGPIS